jgi:hypothetical protein
MPVVLSDAVLKAMGFQPSCPDRQILAAFRSLHLYEVRGLTLEAPTSEPMSGTIGGIAYTLIVGNSVNAMSLKLVQDQFAGSEEEWQLAGKRHPPYLMVLLGPTGKYESTSSHVKEDENLVETYGGFIFAKAELKQFADKVLPALISAIACSFSGCNPPVRFVPTDQAHFGVTPDGRRVLDFVINSSAELSLSSRFSPAQIEEKLLSSVSIAGAMNAKVARFFQLALEDNDPLKKFLYFFLAIEIETHATFKMIDYAKSFSLLISAPDRVAVSAHDFFDGQRQRWTNLRDRFVWCVLCVWTHLSDADVEEFARLKIVRDEIAHGVLANPPHWAVVAAEKLAAKLQL